MTPQAQALVDALGGPDKARIILSKATSSTLTNDDYIALRDAVRAKLSELTQTVTPGIRVTYYDAKAFTTDALSRIMVDYNHPYVRLVMKSTASSSGYRTTKPLAIPGMSALDALNAEGSNPAAVKRVILGNRFTQVQS